MTQQAWQIFSDFRTSFKNKCTEWSVQYREILLPLTFELMKEGPEYSLENPIVYNSALDKITIDSDIKLIVIGDNPGKNEQLTCNQSYLVGQAGKLANGFFQNNSELGIDFRTNVIILNKTPIHTAKTNQIKKLLKIAPTEIALLMEETQTWMAEQTAKLHQKLLASNNNVQLWLVGYSELKDKGIFSRYKKTLLESYHANAAWDNVFVYQHFSMNRFSIDLKNHQNDLDLPHKLITLGRKHKQEIFV